MVPMTPVSASQRQARRRPQVGLVVMLAVFAALMLLPTAGTILFSISEGWTDTILPTRFLPDYWIDALTNPLFLPTFTRALVASGATMIVSVVLMAPTLYVLHVSARR